MNAYLGECLFRYSSTLCQVYESHSCVITIKCSGSFLSWMLSHVFFQERLFKHPFFRYIIRGHNLAHERINNQRALSKGVIYKWRNAPIVGQWRGYQSNASTIGRRAEEGLRHLALCYVYIHISYANFTNIKKTQLTSIPKISHLKNLKNIFPRTIAISNNTQ